MVRKRITFWQLGLALTLGLILALALSVSASYAAPLADNGFGEGDWEDLLLYAGSTYGDPIWGKSYGWSVASAGDVNGDGYADVIVSDPYYNYGGNSNEGGVFVFYGSETGPTFSDEIGVSPMQVYLADWSAFGEGDGDNFGYSAASAGDVNGDGYDDIVVGAPGFNLIGDDGCIDAGKVYVFWGSSVGLGDGGGTGGAPANIEADWTDSFCIPCNLGTEEDPPASHNWSYHGAALGWSVASAGDVGCDGLSDIIVGAPEYDVCIDPYYEDPAWFPGQWGPGGVGSAYVYHGPLGPSPNWQAIGDADSDHFGHSVASAGDIEGDSHSDVIIGAPYYDDGGDTDAGKAYVYFGQDRDPAGPGPEDGLAGIDWTDVGNDAGDQFGYSVASAGDVNGDGHADVIVGAPGEEVYCNICGDNYYEDDVGAAYVYYADFALSLQQEGWYLHTYPDWYAQGECGCGGDWCVGDRQAAPVQVERPCDGGDRFGHSVASVGDVNGDGFAEVIIGAPFYSLCCSDSGCYEDNYWDTQRGCAAPGKVYVYQGGQEYEEDLGLSNREADWTDTGDYDCDWYDEHEAAPVQGIEVYQDILGFSVAGAGDVNGDGYADVIGGGIGEYSGSGIGVSPLDVYAYSDAGKVNVYYGRAELPSAQADWFFPGEDALDDTGYWMEAAFAELGWSVATAGDLNGDGFSDIVAGAPGAGAFFGYGAGPAVGDTTADIGLVAVWYGSELGLYTEGIGVSPLDVYGEPDWMMFGEGPGDKFGSSVAAAGDVNGDGWADLIVGAPGYSEAMNVGKVYAFYGSEDGLDWAGGWSASPAQYPPIAYFWANWSYVGEYEGDYFGNSVAGAGDVNGDGYTDVIIGAYGAGYFAGEAYVFYGSCAGLEMDPAWVGFPYDYGFESFESYGFSVASAGDVNGDGYADIIIGAPGYDDDKLIWEDVGKVYVYCGSEDGPMGCYDFSSGPVIGYYSEPWTAIGEGEGDHFGNSVATAGDVNADGYSDVVIGAYGYGGDGSQQGKMYIYHGGWMDNGFGGLFPYPMAWDVGENDDDRFGRSVATAGDVNGDGYADIIVGADGFDHAGLGLPAYTVAFGVSPLDVYGGNSPMAVEADTDAGRVYVYYGSECGMSEWGCYVGYDRSSGPASEWSRMRATPVWSTTGFYEQDYFGFSVGSAGDVDGDGFADLIVGAYRFPEGDRLGAVAVYYGNDGNDGLGMKVMATQYDDGFNGELIAHPWGSSQDGDDFNVSMYANDPLASGDAVDIELEACPPGVPFGTYSGPEGEYCIRGYSHGCEDPVEGLEHEGSGPYAHLHADFDGDLDVNTVYRWRARALYVPNCLGCGGPNTPPNPPHGPWRRFQAQAMEADINTVVSDLEVEKFADPFQVWYRDTLTYEIVYTNHGPGVPEYILIEDWIDDVPTYTVMLIDSEDISDTLEMIGTPPSYYEWEMDLVNPCKSGSIDIVGIVTYTHWITNPPTAGVHELDDEVKLVYDWDVDFRNNDDWAYAEFIFSPVGGYTAPASPMLLLWPRVAILVAAAGGGVAGLAATLKKRKK